MVCSRAADAEESEERAPARPADHKCNILRVADRDPVARFARTLRPVHERVQSVQPLVSARSLEASRAVVALWGGFAITGYIRRGLFFPYLRNGFRTATIKFRL